MAGHAVRSADISTTMVSCFTKARVYLSDGAGDKS